MRNFTNYIIISLFFGLLFSCNDNEPVQVYADVSILSPAKYTEFDVSDTIMLGVQVSSAGRNVDVTVTLKNGNGIPVMPSIKVENADTGSDITIPFILSDSTLAGGLYHLYAGTISNSAASGRSVPVYINERPKRLQSTWFVTRNNTSELSVVVFDAGLDKMASFTKPGDYAGSDINSTTRQFVVAGSHSGDLVAYNVGDISEAWRASGIPNPVQPYFTLVDFYEDLLLAGFHEGFSRGYNQAGRVAYSTQNSGYTYPDFVMPFGPYLISATTQKSNVNQKWLYVNYLQGGGLLNTKPVNFSPVGFAAGAAGKVLVFGNDEGDLFSTWLLDPESGLITRPYEPFYLPGEKLVATASVSKQTTLLATEEAIYEYISENTINHLFDFDNAGVLSYEPLSERIWLADNETFFIMDFYGNQIHTMQFDGDILNLHFLYNQ